MDEHIGAGLAYLFWAIADNEGEPFDSSEESIGDIYTSLVKLLKSNPNGLWEELVAAGAIV